MNYSIIIPIHNEVDHLPLLLSSLRSLATKNEIIIIDDGSCDGSDKLLKQCDFIKIIKIEQNSGKGFAIRKGLNSTKYDNIILFDGDMELDPQEISKIMLLDNKNYELIIGTRYKNGFPFNSILEFGNFFFTGLFNLLHKQNITDVLCCAKAFNKNKLEYNLLNSNGFDIDVEISIQLIRNKLKLTEIPLSYKRRSQADGKKLRISDSWVIFKRIIASIPKHK